jgi:hypothetical protein
MKILGAISLKILSTEKANQSSENIRAWLQSSLIHKLHAHLVEQFDDLSQVAEKVWIIGTHFIFLSLNDYI